MSALPFAVSEPPTSCLVKSSSMRSSAPVNSEYMRKKAPVKSLDVTSKTDANREERMVES